MSLLSPAGQEIVSAAAARHGFSEEAVTHMLIAVHQGGGSQAQFNHWEFGGMGQWSMGGMSMIGDMFNSALKGRVEALCGDLAGSLGSAQIFQPAPHSAQTQNRAYQGQSQGQSQGSGGGMQMQGSGMQMQGSGMGSTMGGGFGGGSSLFVPGSGFGGGFSTWWPEGLGQPGSTGAQNDMKYAYFPAERRLAILLGGTVTVYDTGPHQISGFGQQQSGDQSLTFTSQNGLVRVADLPVVKMAAEDRAEDPDAAPREKPDETPPAPPQETPVETPPETPAPPPVEIPDPAPTEVPQDTPQDTPREIPTNPAPARPDSAGAGQLGMSSDAIFAALEKLGALRDMGVLTDAEFNAKKTELLARL